LSAATNTPVKEMWQRAHSASLVSQLSSASGSSIFSSVVFPIPRGPTISCGSVVASSK
jgi:hypothetical protein